MGVRMAFSLAGGCCVGDRALMRDRAIGCYVGGAIGDALGAAVEFRPRGTFAEVTGYRGDGPFGLNPGEWTDDTAMARALCWSLRVGRAFHPVDVMERWVSWMREGKYSVNGRCFDIGSRTAAALSRFSETQELGCYSESAWGNGGLMRMAPAAIWGALTGDTSVCVAQSALTHNSELANEWAGRLGRHLVSNIWGSRPPWVELPVPECDGGRADDCFVLARAACGRSRDFKGAVLRAVNFGGDADTIGAVAGQMAGSRFGFEAIVASGLFDGLAMANELFVEASALVDICFEVGGQV